MNRRRHGNAFIEYLVVALVVLLSTIAFYTSNLQQPGVGMRGSVESAFSSLCAQVAGAECQ